MPTGVTQNRNTLRLLFLYADGGALQDLNDRLRTDETLGERKRLDFTHLPDMAIKRLKEVDKLTEVDCPKDGRILFQLGAASATNFVEKMASEWTVITIPLGLCRYERAMSPDRVERDTKVLFKVRFHALIAYHLGVLAGRSSTIPRSVTVGVISDDAQLIPVMADARHQGLDARLVWPESALPDETRYFGIRNGVATMLIDPQLSSGGRAPSQLGYLDKLLKNSK